MHKTITLMIVFCSLMGCSKASNQNAVSMAKCGGYFMAISALHAQHNNITESVTTSKLSVLFLNGLKKMNASSPETDGAFAEAKSISDSELTKRASDLINGCIALAKSPEIKVFLEN